MLIRFGKIVLAHINPIFDVLTPNWHNELGIILHLVYKIVKFSYMFINEIKLSYNKVHLHVYNPLLTSY